MIKLKEKLRKTATVASFTKFITPSPVNLLIHPVQKKDMASIDKRQSSPSVKGKKIVVVGGGKSNNFV